jgi:hypothetical protein
LLALPFCILKLKQFNGVPNVTQSQTKLLRNSRFLSHIHTIVACKQYQTN